eukprot:gene17349-20699_t
MFRLKELQKKQQQEQQQKQAAANQPPATNGSEPAGAAGTTATTDPTEVKRQNSNDLKEIRRQKSKDSYFSLKSKQSSDLQSGKRANPAELRAQKGLYMGATFKFSINIPNTYPYDPPKVHCDTLVYHPNIDLEGHVCLNILRQDWMPVLNIGTVIFGLMTLFLEPNPDDPLNKDAAQVMIDNRKNFEANVRQSLRGGYVSGRNFPKLLN